MGVAAEAAFWPAKFGYSCSGSGAGDFGALWVLRLQRIFFCRRVSADLAVAEVGGSQRQLGFECSKFCGAFLANFGCGGSGGVGFVAAAIAGGMCLVEADSDLAELAVAEVGSSRRSACSTRQIWAVVFKADLGGGFQGRFGRGVDIYFGRCLAS